MRTLSPVARTGVTLWTGPVVLLLATSILSVASYAVFFVHPFGLMELADRPLLDLFRLSGANPQARWLIIAGYLILGGLYWMGWRAAQRAGGRLAWSIVLGGTLASATLLLFMVPFGAADIFDNIMHGRVLGVYGANPFKDVVAQFKGDPFYGYTAWRHAPSAYGPAWELAAGGVAWLVHRALEVRGPGGVANVVAHVLAFKMVGGVFLAGSIGVIAAVLWRQAPERALAGVVLLGWNPVVLVETMGHGHNDIAMIFWVLAAAWALLGGRYLLAVLALVTGALVKFVPILLLPAAMLIALRDLPDRERRLRFLLAAVLAATVLVMLFYAPFWEGPETLSIERRQEMFTTSLPAVGWAILQGPWGKELAAARVSLIAAGLTVVVALWQAGRAWRDRSWLGFTRAAYVTLMTYLLVTCLWFQSWYAIWPLGLAALLPPGHAARLAVLLGYGALAKPLIFEPLWLWQRPLPPKAWRELRLGPAVLALPWLYVLIVWARQKLSGNG